MPANLTLTEPMLRVTNTVLRHAIVDRYGADPSAHPVDTFCVVERTLEGILRDHPHPAARAMAEQFLRTGEFDAESTGPDERITLTLPLGRALALARACFVAAAVDDDVDLRMLDDGRSIQLTIIDRYDVTEDDIRRGFATVAAA